MTELDCFSDLSIQGKKMVSTILQLLMNYINIIITILLTNSKKAFKIFIDQYMISLNVKGQLNEKE